MQIKPLAQPLERPSASLLEGNSLALNYGHPDGSCSPGTWSASNDNLEVVAERSHETHETRYRVRAELIAAKCFDRGQGHAQGPGSSCEGKLSAVQRLDYMVGQTKFDLTLCGVWKPEVGEHVLRPSNNRSTSCSLLVRHDDAFLRPGLPTLVSTLQQLVADPPLSQRLCGTR